MVGNYRSCCRLCLNGNKNQLRSIFDGVGKDADLPERILHYVDVKVSRFDDLSTLLCRDCVRRLDAWSVYHQNCITNQETLTEWLQAKQDENVHIKPEPLDEDESRSELHQQIQIKEEPLDSPPTLTPFIHEDDDFLGTPIPADQINTYIDDDTYCSICNKTFTKSANKRRHDTYLHNKEKTPMQRSQISELPRVSGNDLNSTRPAFDKNFRKPFITQDVSENGDTDPDPTESKDTNEVNGENQISEHKEDREESEINSENYDDTTENINDDQKLEFVAGLELVKKDDLSEEDTQLSKIELSYSKKCGAMVHMHNTLECACHKVQHANLRGLLSHLRSLRIWFPLFTCYHCMISFTDRATYHRHTGKCSVKQLAALRKLANLKERSEKKRRLYQNFKCNRCNYLYSFYEEFIRHVNEEHSSGEPPFYCVFCRDVFDSVEKYQKHVTSQCMISYYCDICFVTTPTLDEFEEHARTQHDHSEGFVLLQNDNYVKVIKKPLVHGIRVDPVIADEHAVQIRGKRERKQPNKNPNMIPHPDSEDDDQPLSKFPRISPARGPTKCPVCEKEYSNSFNMIRHYKKAHPDLVNQMNVDPKNNESVETDGGEEADDSFYACPDCEGVYDSASWAVHVKSHPLIQCDKCSKTFQFKTELEQHRASHLTLKISRDSDTSDYRSSILNVVDEAGVINMDDEDDMHMCEICELIFTSEQDLQAHQATHINQESNEDISIDDPDPSEFALPSLLPTAEYLAEHLKSHGIRRKEKQTETLQRKKLSYDACNEFFDSPDDLAHHIQELHTEGSEHSDDMPVLTNELDIQAINVYTCDICVLTFPSKSAMKKHKETSHKNQIPILPKVANQGTVYCKLCKIAFIGEKEMAEHMLAVHDVKSIKIKGEKIYKCPTCNKGFSSLGAMNAHAGWHKRGIAKYPPPPTSPMQSGREKPNKNSTKVASTSYNRAADSYQLESSRHQCSICLTEFPSEAALRLHVLEKHGNSSEDILFLRCDICHQDFHTQQEFNKHQRFHHFLELQQHHEIEIVQQRMQANMGPSPSDQSKSRFPCRHCKSEFSRIDTLTAHIKQKHPDQMQTIFKCPHCDRIFDKQNSLSIHLKVHEQKQTIIPPGVGKLVCSICNMKFQLAKELRNHTIQAHPF